MADLPKLRQCNAVVSVGTHQIRTGNRLAFVHLSDLPFVCGVRERARAGLGASWRGTPLQVFWSSGLVPNESEVRIILQSLRLRTLDSKGTRDLRFWCGGHPFGAGWLRVTAAAISSLGGAER